MPKPEIDRVPLAASFRYAKLFSFGYTQAPKITCRSSAVNTTSVLRYYSFGIKCIFLSPPYSPHVAASLFMGFPLENIARGNHGELLIPAWSLEPRGSGENHLLTRSLPVTSPASIIRFQI